MAEQPSLDTFWLLVREALTRPAAAHPSDDELVGYLLNELSAEQVERLERHLRTCPLCSETVERLGGRGGMVHDPARDLVTAILRCETSAMTADEIHRVLRDKGRSASVTEVHSALSSLLAEGLLASEREARQLRYRLAVPPDLPCEPLPDECAPEPELEATRLETPEEAEER